MHRIFGMLATLLVVLSAPASAETLRVNMNGESMSFISAGEDEHGRRYEASNGTYFWVNERGDLIRLKYPSKPAFGTVNFVRGGPGETWNFDYTKTHDGQKVRRYVRCSASDVRDGRWTVHCTDRRADRDFPLNRKFVMDAEKSVWVERSSNALGTTYQDWQVTSIGE